MFRPAKKCTNTNATPLNSYLGISFGSAISVVRFTLRSDNRTLFRFNAFTYSKHNRISGIHDSECTHQQTIERCTSLNYLVVEAPPDIRELLVDEEALRVVAYPIAEVLDRYASNVLADVAEAVDENAIGKHKDTCSAKIKAGIPCATTSACACAVPKSKLRSTATSDGATYAQSCQINIQRFELSRSNTEVQINMSKHNRHDRFSLPYSEPK